MIMSNEDYQFMYAKIETYKIPDDILAKIMTGEDFNEEEEIRMKKIIEKEREHAKKMIVTNITNAKKTLFEKRRRHNPLS